MSGMPIDYFDALKPLETLAYALGRPAGSAAIKREFVDFRVDEELAFEPTGEGEHVFLQIKKTDASTLEVARRLERLAGVAQADVGYSGMKDRRAETSQWFSVKLPQEHESRLDELRSNTHIGVGAEGVEVLTSARNARKLKIGSHARNRFRLRLRDCQGPVEDFERRLQAIRRDGVPNYFGAQRFGAQLSNLRQVAELMRATAAGEKGARKTPRFKRSMLYSAARSYLFNQVLSARVGGQSWDQYRAGDVLSLAGSGRCFLLGEGEDWDETLEQRLRSLDIHPTGPLPGLISAKDKYVSLGEAADIERVAIKEYDWMLDGLKAFGLQAARRPLRFHASDLTWEWEGATSESPALCLEFFLPRGAYATSLLRELCQLRER